MAQREFTVRCSGCLGFMGLFMFIGLFLGLLALLLHAAGIHGPVFHVH